MASSQSHRPLTFDDASREGTLKVIAASQTLGWQGIFATHIQVYPDLPKERLIPGASFLMHTEGPPVQLHRRWHGRWENGYSIPHNLCLTSGKEPVEYGYSRGSENILYGVSADLMTTVFSEIGKGDPEYHQIQERFIFRDAFAEQIGWILIRLLADGDHASKLYAEALGVTLAHHMIRVYSTSIPIINSQLPNMSQPQLRIVLEYLDANFAQPIGLVELANIIGLSVSHFSRLFRQSTGYSPYQYLIRLRCEKGRALLETGNFNITQIAQAVGFFDHSHFVRHFKRLYHMTPQQWVGNNSLNFYE
jgi:AraC family transcriptional regulator